MGASNGDATFAFFDNFPGSTLNTSKWMTTISGSGTITVSGNTARLCALERPGEDRVYLCYLRGVQVEAQLKCRPLLNRVSDSTWLTI